VRPEEFLDQRGSKKQVAAEYVYNDRPHNLYSLANYHGRVKMEETGGRVGCMVEITNSYTIFVGSMAEKRSL
jgi:hypothetical protein